jgi:hypothetical protein
MLWHELGNQARVEVIHTARWGTGDKPNGFTLVEGGLRVKARGPQQDDEKNEKARKHQTATFFPYATSGWLP